MVYQEVRGLHQAAYVLALFAFGSQLLALVRDRLLASEFGAGAELDIYYAAFRIPDLLYVLFASTLSVYVLIPFVARYQKRDQGEEARHLLSQIFSLFLVGYTALALIVGVFAPSIVAIIFPGIEDQSLLVMVLRVLLLQPLFLGISSLFGVVTQLGHRFVLYALSPLVYNVGIIFGVVFLYPIFGLMGIAMGVVIGACSHMAIQWPLVRAGELAFSIVTKINWKEIRSVLLVSIPRAFTLSINQLVLLVLVSLASLMVAGSVSVFQFAFNLQSVPLAIIGVSYSVAAFPVLAELFAAKDTKKFDIHVSNALRHIIFWAIPATVLIIVLRAQIVRVTLGSGAFDWDDTRLTAAVLAALVIALTAHAINLLLIRVFYAGGNTRAPLFTAIFTGLLAIVTAYSFSLFYTQHSAVRDFVTHFMRVPDVVGSEVLALAFGYSIAMIVQTLILLFLIRKTFNFSLGWMPRKLLEATAAATFGGVAAYAALNFLVEGLNTNTFIGIFLQGTLAGLFGLVGVVLGYAAFHSLELKEVTESFQRRLFKTDVVAPQEDVL